MIVLDASVLIAYLDGDDGHHELAAEVLAREVDDDLLIDPLTLAEVLVVPARDERLDEVTAALAELQIQELPFPDGAGTTLARVRADTGLRMPDCCVLMAAEQAAARLASFDARLRRVAEARDIVVLDR